MQFQVPDLFVAPYLKTPTAEAWQEHREQYYAYRSRGGTLGIRLLIARDVWEVLKLRDPTLGDFEVPAGEGAEESVRELVRTNAEDDDDDSDDACSDNDSSSDDDNEAHTVKVGR
ncbi:hypothetical protein J8273_8733 [Carpediemonas membranifera]|uniref:Uncharacterized protein n=1 Tax=Carpediemonas membranifera TaxID=201153 RepID=A0A8J6DYQ9_9EUKA|nr:hypothetical protein J8273_8733 [Carpediemonas membranifera]|eukprot:KAG9389441.1 hypothetical protein J8273_8733 [Carpediemonas membranifera]